MDYIEHMTQCEMAQRKIVPAAFLQWRVKNLIRFKNSSVFALSLKKNNQFMVRWGHPY